PQEPVVALQEPGEEVLPGAEEQLGAPPAPGQTLEIFAPVQAQGLGPRHGQEVDVLGLGEQRAGIRAAGVGKAAAAQAADQEGPRADVEALQRLEFQLEVVEVAEAEIEAVG